MHTVLVVDDELSIRESFNLILKDKYKVLQAASGEAAIGYAADKKIDLVFLDIRMPGLDGLETLKRLKEINSGLPVIMVTAVNDVSRAALSVKLGALDYIIKPFDVEKILSLTEKITRRQDLLQGLSAPAFKDEPILSAQVLEQAKKAAKTSEPVLLIGKAGCEKEAAAYFIHCQSKFAAFPFGVFNLPKRLAPESLRNKLFGKKTGETTVTLRKEPGLLEKYSNGTIFINHFENLPPEILPELLSRQERFVFGAGAEPADESLIKIVIRIAPLRERVADLPQLVEFFLQKHNALFRKNIRGLSKEAKEILFGYHFPGNMEELASLMERLVLKSDSEIIEKIDLPFDLLVNSTALPYSDLTAIFEQKFTAQGRNRTGMAYSTEGF